MNHPKHNQGEIAMTPTTCPLCSSPAIQSMSTLYGPDGCATQHWVQCSASDCQLAGPYRTTPEAASSAWEDMAGKLAT
jgi:hypothetical protein